MSSGFKKTLIGNVLVSLALILCVDSVLAQNTMNASDAIQLYERARDTSSIPVITCIDLHKDGTLLAIGGDDHVVRLWDVNKRDFVLNFREHLDWVRSLAFSSDQSQLATIGQDGQIKIWDIKNGQLLHAMKDPIRGTQKVVFHPSGNYIAVCGFDENVRFYNSSNGRHITSVAAHGQNNKAMAFSADGTRLAVGGRTGVVRVWSVSADGAVLQQPIDIKGDGRRINAVAFNSNGSRLAIGGDGPFISVWNPASGQQIEVLPERPGKTFSLIFCGNNMLASGESDNVIRLWNLLTKQNTTTLIGHSGTISSMVYESKTSRLISGSFDTSVRFWTVDEKVDSQPSAPEIPASFAAPIVPSVQQNDPIPTFATPAFPVVQ